jgi:hypothetical protein
VVGRIFQKLVNHAVADVSQDKEPTILVDTAQLVSSFLIPLFRPFELHAKAEKLEIRLQLYFFFFFCPPVFMLAFLTVASQDEATSSMEESVDVYLSQVAEIEKKREFADAVASQIGLL